MHFNFPSSLRYYLNKLIYIVNAKGNQYKSMQIIRIHQKCTLSTLRGSKIMTNDRICSRFFLKCNRIIISRRCTQRDTAVSIPAKTARRFPKSWIILQLVQVAFHICNIWSQSMLEWYISNHKNMISGIRVLFFND